MECRDKIPVLHTGYLLDTNAIENIARYVKLKQRVVWDSNPVMQHRKVATVPVGKSHSLDFNIK
jgi:hypothetical protein